MKAWLKRLFQRRIWIVYEDNHGAVSWWTSKRKAIKEANGILKDMYCCDCDYDCNHQEFDECDCVSVYSEVLNRTWR